jgi:hypothetical protein
MSPEIEVDDDVFEVLRQNAEPFVDTPNSVLRRLLRLKDGAELSPSPARHAVRHLQAAPRERSRRSTVRPPRAPRGSLLPQEEYEVPILQILADQPEGRAPASEVIDGIEPMMRDKFKELDLETMSGGEVRWHKRAQFCRLHLVKMGQMAPHAPRGIWEITDEGRDRLRVEAERRTT